MTALAEQGKSTQPISCSARAFFDKNKKTVSQNWRQLFLSLVIVFIFLGHYDNGPIRNLYSMVVRHQISNFLSVNYEIASPDPTSSIRGLQATYTITNGSSEGIVNNYFGDALGAMNSGHFSAYNSDLGGYGPMPGSSVANNLTPQWRGHYLDGTGFYYMGARYYEPNSGRFLSADPLGHDASLSLYDYCNGDPVNGLDSDGRCVEKIVPGNTAWQQSVSSYNNGDYVGAAVGVTSMIGEQVLTVASLGMGSVATAGIEAATSMASEAIESAEVVAQDSVFTTWNEFQTGTRGQFANRAEAGAAWNNYRNENYFQILTKKVETLDVSTAANQAVFYSGTGNRALAESFAASNGRLTLEKTVGGSWLEKQKLFNPLSILSPNEALSIWSRLSERYAEEASGIAIGFVKGARLRGIFNTVEFPTLQANPRIINVITGGQ